MANFEPHTIQASCGHEFEIPIRTSVTCFSNPEYLEDLLSGQCCVGVCPVCSKDVVFYHGFILDTICERIGIYPKIWKSKMVEENPDVDTLVFEEYGTPFVNLEKHLRSLELLNEDGSLNVERIKEKMIEKGMDPDDFGNPDAFKQ
jgi:hypothetical protein